MRPFALLTLVCLAASSTALAGEHLDRTKRWLGFGYGPGYHAGEGCCGYGACGACGRAGHTSGVCPCRVPNIPRIPPQYLCGGAFAHRYPPVSPYYVGPATTYMDYYQAPIEETVVSDEPVATPIPTPAPTDASDSTL